MIHVQVNHMFWGLWIAHAQKETPHDFGAVGASPASTGGMRVRMGSAPGPEAGAGIRIGKL